MKCLGKRTKPTTDMPPGEKKKGRSETLKKREKIRDSVAAPRETLVGGGGDITLAPFNTGSAMRKKQKGISGERQRKSKNESTEEGGKTRRDKNLWDERPLPGHEVCKLKGGGRIQRKKDGDGWIGRKPKIVSPQNTLWKYKGGPAHASKKKRSGEGERSKE